MRKDIILILIVTSVLSSAVYLNVNAVYPWHAKGVKRADVYMAMFKFLEDNQYSKIMESVILLDEEDDLMDVIMERYGLALKDKFITAIKKRDDIAIFDDIQQLVFFDIINMLDIIKKTIDEAIYPEKGIYSSEDIRDGIKSAYTNYQVLSPYLRRRNFYIDQHIKKAFQDAYQGINPSAIERGERINIEMIKRYVEMISEELWKTFTMD